MHVYTVYGWPATAESYTVVFHDTQTGADTTLSLEQEDNTYGYESSDLVPGLLLVYPNFTSGTARPYTFALGDVDSMATIRWMTRTGLNDVEAGTAGVDIKYPDNPKWPDAEIDSYIREAVGLFNTYRPREYIVETTVDRLRRDILGDFDEVTSISYYDLGRNQWEEIPRAARERRRQRMAWDFDSRNIRLYSVPSTARLEISLIGDYPIPRNDLEPIGIPREHWDILRMYSQGKCFVRLEAQAAQLDRWKEHGSRRDNPIIPVAKYMMNDAINRLKDRKGSRAIRRIRR